MIAAFRKLSLLWQLLSLLGAVGAIGGALWGAYAWVRHDGYIAGQAEATARCELEKATQRKANEMAIDTVNRQLIRMADELTEKQQELDDAQMARDAAAAADPDGARECLGAGSVQRLNAVR